MFECAVCGCKKSRLEAVTEVFKVDGSYVLVEEVPAEVCDRCGEQSFSLDTAEKVRQTVAGGVPPVRSVEMRVFAFDPEELSSATGAPLRDRGADG